MTLDQNVMRLDELGIIPNEFEKPESFIKRGLQILKKYSAESMATYMENRLHNEVGLNRNVYLPNQSDMKKINSVVQEVKKRFCCDYSWLQVGYSEMNTYDGARFGLAFGPSMSRPNGEELWSPPFVLINRFGLGKRGVMVHEFIHMPIQIGNYYPLGYPRDLKYCERIANQATPIRAVLSSIFHPIVTSEHLRVKSKLKNSFGKMAGYVQVRMRYDQVKDLLLEQNRNPAELIKLRAKPERQDLLFQIMAERLGL